MGSASDNPLHPHKSKNSFPKLGEEAIVLREVIDKSKIFPFTRLETSSETLKAKFTKAYFTKKEYASNFNPTKFDHPWLSNISLKSKSFKKTKKTTPIYPKLPFNDKNPSQIDFGAA